MRNRAWSIMCVGVALLIGLPGAAMADEVRPPTELVIFDAVPLLLDGDCVQFASGQSIFELHRIVPENGRETLLVVVATEDQGVIIEDFSVLGPGRSLGMRWTGQIDGEAIEGNLIVAIEPDQGATINLLGGPLAAPTLSIKLTTTEEAALALIELSRRVALGYEPGKDGGLAATWPCCAWYCGCRWGSGNMTLCAGNPPPCEPQPTAICPGPVPPVNCQWFMVWGGGIGAPWENTDPTETEDAQPLNPEVAE